jgi:hypothetical protein
VVPLQPAILARPASVAVVDLDGDGALDIVTADINGNDPDHANPDGADLSIVRGRTIPARRSP